MAQQAYVLLDVGRQGDALAVAVAAKDAVRGGPPDVLTAWLHAVEREMAAACGDELGARRALDMAAAVVPDEGTDSGPLPYIALDASHLARWRGNRGHRHARTGRPCRPRAEPTACPFAAPPG
jgi:hypothetical protein